MSTISSHITEAIYKRVKADLEPDAIIVYGKSGFSVLIGGLISLFLCGQFGFGLSSVAIIVNQLIMQFMGMVGCTALCGILFAVVPVAILRLSCSSVQFRTMTRKKWHVLAMWIFGFGCLLMLWNAVPNPIFEILVWSFAAIFSFASLAWLLDYTAINVVRSNA